MGFVRCEWHNYTLMLWILQSSHLPPCSKCVCVLLRSEPSRSWVDPNEIYARSWTSRSIERARIRQESPIRCRSRRFVPSTLSVKSRQLRRGLPSMHGHSLLTHSDYSFTEMETLIFKLSSIAANSLWPPALRRQQFVRHRSSPRWCFTRIRRLSPFTFSDRTSFHPFLLRWDKLVELFKGLRALYPHHPLFDRFADPFIFRFCHGDLHDQNILIDPSTGKTAGIVDRDCAGFCPVVDRCGRRWMASRRPRAILIRDISSKKFCPW